MRTQPIKLSAVAVGLVAVALLEFLPACAIAQSHPQEVVDLIAAHQALAMKIRPLQDRVLTASQENSDRFKPEGAPVRAKGSATTAESSTRENGRVAERLRHKDRAATDSDDYGRIRIRLSALEKKARAERERVNRPDFGVGLAGRDRESGEVGFGDGRVGARPKSGKQQQEKSGGGVAGNINATETADARRSLAALQRELAVLEREVNAL